MALNGTWKRLRNDWAIHTYYQRFESAVALVLTLVIGLIILVALFRLDLSEVSPGHLLGLAGVTLALGITYWLMRERDDRAAGKARE